jgi:hypothetical protein
MAVGETFEVRFGSTFFCGASGESAPAVSIRLTAVAEEVKHEVRENFDVVNAIDEIR